MADEKEIKDINYLNACYKEAEDCDKEVFSEQRVNVQLVAGDHYYKQGSRFWNRLRDTKTVAPDQKIRLTKNHIGRITKIYQNALMSGNPSVTISPKQEKEIQHQKAAELHSSVIAHIKEVHDIERKKHLWAKDYVEIGEVCVKVFWDPTLGIQVGWEPVVDELGQPVVDPMTGQLQQSQSPVMSGDLVFETVHGFDLLRHPGVKSMDESPYLIIRKMENTKDLLRKFGYDPEKEKFIKESSEDTFRVFKHSSSTYEKTKGMCMVREQYFKPCAEYRNGYYFISTELGILEQGELPFGIFPLHFCGFDEVTTSARARSIIRQLRPYQIEINRASSKMAEHQVTLGDDKVFFQAGSKPSSSATKPGIRYESYVGAPPVVIQGRNGEQYLPYISAQIAEMYQVAEVAELDKEINGQLDPYTLLFRSMKQKQKFSHYSDKFERFLVSVHKTALKLFKKYASEQLMVPVLGKNEVINIPELKNSNDICYEIKIEPMTDDIETKMGKQLTLNHILQYVGPQMDKKDTGKLLRLSPYLNTEKMFQDMTQDYDNLNNDILALDRGQYPQANRYEDHEYMVKGLVSRIKQPDFRFLRPDIQEMYYQKVQEHEQAIAMKAMEIKQAQSEFIPSGGYLTVCDLYERDPNNPKSTKRVRIPSESLTWLLKQLEVQGTTQESMEAIANQQAISEIAGMTSQGNETAGPPLRN